MAGDTPSSFWLPAERATSVLAAGLATSALVSTVMMATLVVGPFHLAHALGLGAAAVGLVLTSRRLEALFLR